MAEAKSALVDGRTIRWFRQPSPLPHDLLLKQHALTLGIPSGVVLPGRLFHAI